MGTVERRRNPRFETRVPGRVTLAHGEVLHGEVLDVCRDAALLALPRTLAIGTVASLCVSLPGFLGDFDASGAVVRLAGPVEAGQGVVVLFNDLNPKAATAIDLYLERLAGEGSPLPEKG